EIRRGIAKRSKLRTSVIPAGTLSFCVVTLGGLVSHCRTADFSHYPNSALVSAFHRPIVWRSVGDLKPFPRIRQRLSAPDAAAMKGIQQVWTTPILIDVSRMILARHSRLETARPAGVSEVPTVILPALRPGRRRR